MVLPDPSPSHNCVVDKGHGTPSHSYVVEKGFGAPRGGAPIIVDKFS